MRTLFIVLFSVIFSSCSNPDKKETAQSVIDKAIEVSCQGNCDSATIDFTFRKKQYKSVRNGGGYTFSRTAKDSTGVIIDVLSNEGFTRKIDGVIQELNAEDIVKIGDNVNSVHYFVQLPYGLNAPAVNKKLVGEVQIKGNTYYQIAVDFNEEGGGTDHEDKYMYWIHKDNFTLDYLAYSYAVNGGGIRFREGYNPRVIDGIRFLDYNNYKPANLQIKLEELPNLFETGNLKLLSKIETESISVTIN